jgi:hypothetical protein
MAAEPFHMPLAHLELTEGSMQTQRIRVSGTGAAVFVVMAAFAPSANGQTVTSSGNPGSVSIAVLKTAPRTVPLKIRDWPLGNASLAVPIGPAPTRVAASASASSARIVRQRSRSTRAAQRVTAGVAMGILGFLAGGVAGAGVGAGFDREYGPIQGFVIGGAIGAGAGAALGVLMVR